MQIDSLRARLRESEARVAELEAMLPWALQPEEYAKKDAARIAQVILAERERCIRLVALAEGEWAARKLLEEK